MATVEAPEQKRWEGSAKSHVSGVSINLAWSLVSDFFHWKKILPAIKSSIAIEGISGQVGCTRKVTLIPQASLGWVSKDRSRWGVEKLVEIDHARKWLKYKVLDNDFGWENYEAIMAVDETIEGFDLIWSFSLDPVTDGRTLENMITDYKSAVDRIGNHLKETYGVEAPEQKRWEGSARSQVSGVSIDLTWSLVSDFFHWKKILPAIESSIAIEGISGQVGCTRRVTLIPQASLGWVSKDRSRWGVEKLVEIDHARKWLKYKTLDNDFGWENYEATMAVDETIEGFDLIWSFLLDPVTDGRTLENMIADYKSAVDLIGNHLKETYGGK